MEESNHPLHLPRNQAIDILRGFAISLVLFRHSHYLLPTTIFNYPIILQGTWSGVDLFFVISGFVITLGLLPTLKAYSEGTYQAHQVLKAFFIRRFFRLLPLSWLALVLNLVFAFFYNQSGQFGVWSEVKTEILPILFYYYNYFVYRGGSGHLSWYWSLSIEEQFYIFYPFILLVIPSNQVRIWGSVGIMVLITFILRPLLTPEFASVDHKLWPRFTTPSHLRFDCIIAGCLLGFLYFRVSQEKLRERLANHHGFVRAISVISLFGIATAGAILPHFELTSYPLIIFCSMVMVGLAILDEEFIVSFGLGKTMNWLGRRSYSIYLIHCITISFMNETWFRLLGKQKGELTWIQGGIGLILAYGFSFIFAELAYHWIEKPCIRYGRRISDELFPMTHSFPLKSNEINSHSV